MAVPTSISNNTVQNLNTVDFFHSPAIPDQSIKPTTSSVAQKIAKKLISSSGTSAIKSLFNFRLSKNRNAASFRSLSSTKSIVQQFKTEGSSKVLQQIKQKLPEGVKEKLIFEYEKEAGRQLGIKVSGNLVEDVKLGRGAACCVAERYSQKYGVEIFHIGKSVSPSTSDQYRNEMSNEIANKISPLLKKGKPVGLIADISGGHGSNYHSVPIVILPDPESGQVHWIDSNSVAAICTPDKGEIEDLSLYSNFTFFNPALQAVVNKTGLSGQYWLTNMTRQSDNVSCHTDTLQTLKELLRNDGEVARQIVGELNSNVGQFPPEMLKTPQREKFLAGKDLSKVYRKKATVQSHREKHTIMTTDKKGAAKSRNLFLPAKTLQYIQVGVDHLNHSYNADKSQALDEIIKKRSINRD